MVVCRFFDVSFLQKRHKRRFICGRCFSRFLSDETCIPTKDERETSTTTTTTTTEILEFQRPWTLGWLLELVLTGGVREAILLISMVYPQLMFRYL